MTVHLVTLQRSGASSSYRIYTEKNLRALHEAGAADAAIEAAPASAESTFGGVLRPTWTHFVRSFPRDGVFRHACEPNTAYRHVDVVTIHDLYPFLQTGMMYRAFRIVARSAAHRARRIVTQLEAIKRDIGHFLGSEALAKTRVVPPPFPIPPLGRESVQRDLLWIGNPDPRKHAERLLQGLATLDGPRRRVTFLCHGQTSPAGVALGGAYEAARRRHDVEWVDRHVDDAELDHLYRSSRAILSTSSLEGFHNPPMEAWARGTPAVLPDLPLYREIYGSVAGVHYYDARGTFDVALAAALGAGPHTPDEALLRSLSFPEIGKRLLGVYRELGG